MIDDGESCVIGGRALLIVAHLKILVTGQGEEFHLLNLRVQAIPFAVQTWKERRSLISDDVQMSIDNSIAFLSHEMIRW